MSVAAITRRVGAVAAPKGHEHYHLDVTGGCTCACDYVAESRDALRPHYDFERAGFETSIIAVHNSTEDVIAWCERQLIAIAAGSRLTSLGEHTSPSMYEQPIAALAQKLNRSLAVAA